MSTRSTTHLIAGDHTSAIIYRHADGYPEGHGVDLQRFFGDVEEQTQDTRYSDPSYLAAKLVVWLANEFAVQYVQRKDAGDREVVKDFGDYVYVAAERLDFLSVGVVQEDPGDIEYRYTIDCSQFDERGRPVVKCYEVGWGTEAAREVPIPAATVA